MHWAAQRNLLQMVDTGSNDDVYVAAQIDSPQDQTRRYVFPQRPLDTERWVVLPESSLGNINSADPQSILDFFAWGIAECPAKNTMLVLWGHGFGLDDYTPTGVWPISFPAPRPAANFVAPVNSLTDRAIVDEHSHSVLNNNQIGDVVRACREMVRKCNGDLAILGMDCCEMGMAEVWCEMAGGAQIAIGSQASLPYASWPYDLFLAQLLAKPRSAPASVSTLTSLSPCAKRSSSRASTCSLPMTSA